MTRPAPAAGWRKSPCGKVRVTVPFDPDTFDEIRERAVSEGTSFAEQVRLLLEWGLESAAS